MVQFILNDQDINTSLPPGTTVLDFVRYHKDLKGTKMGCREGDCGACTILVDELIGNDIRYRSMMSCLMPLANADGKHIVTIEGINPNDGSLTPVQQAMVDENGTQCGFCTPGFVMSLTGFCLGITGGSAEAAVSSIDGNICRCTGYKSIERAANVLSSAFRRQNHSLLDAIDKQVIPEYFSSIPRRLKVLEAQAQAPPKGGTQNAFVGGGTDVYVQKPEQMAENSATHLFYDDELRAIRDTGEYVEIGASVTVTDLLESPVMQQIFPDLYKHLKLVSSTPIRNMATLAGNFVNASPIGDMTVWFLALNAEIDLTTGQVGDLTGVRTILLRDLYQGYKQLAKSEDEFITKIRFRKPAGDFRFNFEKVCKRTYLDIATVNTAISLTVSPTEPDDGPPPPKFIESEIETPQFVIESAHVAAGGVAPVPLYLKETSNFLAGKPATLRTVREANEIMQSEISPISDVRGTADYKRLLLHQLFRANFHEILGLSAI